MPKIFKRTKIEGSEIDFRYMEIFGRNREFITAFLYSCKVDNLITEIDFRKICQKLLICQYDNVKHKTDQDQV